MAGVSVDDLSYATVNSAWENHNELFSFLIGADSCRGSVEEIGLIWIKVARYILA